MFKSKSSSHQEMMARLNYLKDHRGIGMVTGEPGSGKTSSLRAFVASLNPSLYKVAYFPLSTVTVQDFYRGLAFSLGLEPAFRKVDLFKQIQEAVQGLFFERKVVPFIILDELQLSINHHLPLNQRLIMRYKVQPLTRDEVKSYLEHQMNLAGAKYPIFSDGAVEAITAVSRGWPRLINNLAVTSLIYGYQMELKYIDEEAVRQAAAELGM